MMNERSHRVIALLAANEETIARLYGNYALRHPGASEFWLDLARDEERHATWICNLAGKAETKGLYVNARRFNPRTIECFIEHVESCIEKSKGGGITHAEALATARDLEGAILDRKVFSVFEGEHEAARTVRRRLEDETEGHRDRVNRVWERSR